MGMRYQTYLESKASNIEWIGNIPSHWLVKPLFGSASTESIKNEEGKESNILSLSYGKIIKRDVDKNFGLLPESFNTYQLVNPGELILRLTDLQNDKRSLRVGHAKERGIITSAYLKLVPKKDELNDRYLYRLLHSYDTTKVFYGMGGGLRQSMRFEDMKRLPILVPQLAEQEQIANFFDHETAKIDTLIEKQQQLIKLLTEKRQAVISHAVTKGLNPNAPMRDSGVEWLGEVPEHWEVMQLRRLTRLQQGLQIPQDNRFAESGKNRIEYLTVKSINAGDRAEHKEYIYSASERVVCNEDEILLARTGATGQVVTNVSGAFHNNFFKVNYDKNKVLKNYLVYFLKVTEVKNHLLMLAGTTTIPDLNHGAFLGTLTCLPDFEEQRDICRYLDKTLKRYDYICMQAQSFVNLMKERRTALITEVVTGKIDVRNWQAPEQELNQ